MALYRAIHNWIHRHKSKVKNCESCGKSKKLDAASKDGTHKKDINHYLWLCRKCHVAYDHVGEKNKKNFTGKPREKISRSNTSGYIGVSWSKEKCKWKVYTTPNKKQKHIGYFSKKSDAIKAYRKYIKTIN